MSRTIKKNSKESARGACAETRTILGPFEPDLGSTSVGKWSFVLYKYVRIRQSSLSTSGSELFFEPKAGFLVKEDTTNATST